MTSLEKMHAQLKAIHEQRGAIFEQIKPLQEQAALLYKQITDLNDCITKETLKTEQSEQDRFDFLMAENNSGSDMVRYNAASTMIRNMGLYMTSFCEFSQQRLAEVIIYKLDEESNNKAIASMKKLIELFKPMDEEGNKHFKVFCQDSKIFAHADGTFSLRKHAYRADFATLDELFAYYVDNCPCYDDEEPSDNDDSDNDD